MTSALGEAAVKVGRGRIYPWEFDRKGKLPAWHLLDRLNYFSLYQAPVFQPQPEGSLPQAYEMRFLRCQSIEFSSAFHELVELPGRDFCFEAQLIFVGKTSWMYETKVVDRTTGRELATRRVQTVSVDYNTRRPKPLPDWVMEQYRHLTSLARPAAVQPFDLSGTKPAFVYPVTVAPSDIDGNLHTNSSQYLRYCFDCATAGAKRGAYSIINGDLLDYDVKNVDLLYQKESLEGDVLHVESWEDIREPDIIKFQVKRGDDNLLQCKIRFCIPSVPVIEKAKL